MLETSGRVPSRLLPEIAELAGIAAVTAGCYLLQTWLALIVGGVLLVVKANLP